MTFLSLLSQLKIVEQEGSRSPISMTLFHLHEHNYLLFHDHVDIFAVHRCNRDPYIYDKMGKGLSKVV